jgi:hypothetical protein
MDIEQSNSSNVVQTLGHTDGRLIRLSSQPQSPNILLMVSKQSSISNRLSVIAWERMRAYDFVFNSASVATTSLVHNSTSVSDCTAGLSSDNKGNAGSTKNKTILSDSLVAVNRNSKQNLLKEL